MSRYQGVRRRERAKLNRHQEHAGGALSFSWSADGALDRVVEHVERDLQALDKRTNPNQNLVAAVERLKALRQELRR